MGLQYWGHDVKLAVLVTVMLETWSEGKAPGYSPMTTPLMEEEVPERFFRCLVRPA